jgi:hypothetical protein
MIILGEPFDVKQVVGRSLITSTYVGLYEVHPSWSSKTIVDYVNSREPKALMLLQEVTEH